MPTPKAKKGKKGFEPVVKTSVQCTYCKKIKKVTIEKAATFKWCNNKCKGKSMENRHPYNKLSLDKYIYVKCSLPGCCEGKYLLPCRWRRMQKLKLKAFCSKKHSVEFRKISFHEEFEIKLIREKDKNSKKQIWSIN